MSTDRAIANLEYLKSLAETGQRTPLLGGKFGLAWTLLLIPMLVVHGLSLGQVIGLPIENIGFLWLGFGLVGGVLMVVLRRTSPECGGAGSVGNQIERTIWPITALLIFAFAISVTLSTLFFGAPTILYNMIMPLAFGLNALNYGVLSRMTGETYLGAASWCAAAFMVATTVFIMRPEVYFIAALGVLLSGVIPSLLELRRETTHVE